VVGADRIKMLLGDREFIGDEWFAALIALGVPFVMRLRQNMTVDGDGICAKMGAYLLKKQEITGERVQMGTQMVTFAGKVLKGGELLGVAAHGVDEPLEAYKRRWGIEIGFACLKTKGFDLEGTKLSVPERLVSLIKLCAIAVGLAVHVGANAPQLAHEIAAKKKMEHAASHCLPRENASSNAFVS
jgi:Transposase DDE domain